MTKRMGLRQVVCGIVIAGAMSLTSALGGVVEAAERINIGVGELQECTISKSVDAGGDVDGRDFLVWQKTTSPSR